VEKRLAFGQGTDQGSKVISLLEVSLTHFHNIGEVSANLPEKLVTNATFACKQPVERILVVRRLWWKDVEFLNDHLSALQTWTLQETTYPGQNS
jgi:hypothetical protein